MKGKCFIDNIDIYDRYGVVIRKDGYKDLLTFPALKEPGKNDWPEEDGVEVDLDSPRLQTKTVTLPFVAKNPFFEVNDFIAFITKPGYRTIRIPTLGKEWKIRMNSQTENKIHPKATNFSLQFIDDAPTGARMKTYTPVPGSGLTLMQSAYELDAVPFDKYGVVVESGLDDLLKSPTAKQNLAQSLITSDGQVYDADHLVFNSKETTLKCLFITSSVQKFWECYYAFFNDWIQPKERTLYCEHTGEEYPCYYKKSSGFQIEEMSSRFVCSFNLTIEFISFRISETDYILATEDQRHIVLEDGETRVDMKVYAY